MTPLVAVVAAVRAQEPQSVFLWLGSRTGLEASVARTAEVPFRAIPTGKLRRYFSLRTIHDIFVVPFGVAVAWWQIGRFRPDVIFGKGGYVSYPVGIAAYLRGIPFVLHESDAVPGVANQRLARRAAAVAVTFAEARAAFPEDVRPRVVVTGTPLQAEILSGDATRARQLFSLTADKPTIFITGGSQGAAALNEAILAILPQLLTVAHVIHQVGNRHAAQFEAIGQQYYAQGYRAYPFLPPAAMGDAYALADAVVARAASTTLTEIAAWRKPALLIPLPTAANNHQHANALLFAGRKAAIVLDQENLVPRFFFQQIERVLTDVATRTQLQTNIAAFHAPDAAQALVTLLRAVALPPTP